MNLINARASIDAALAALTTAKAQLAADAGADVVRAGANLQAALDRGGRVELEADAVFVGTYVLRSDTVLVGHGATIDALAGPALAIPPGTHRVAVSDLIITSRAREVVSIGANDATQTTLDQVPTDVTFTEVRVPTHRNVRAFAIHGARVSLLDCEVLDCWDPAGQDSQAIYIGNTPGPVTVRGGRYTAGSEVFLSGGDQTRIQHVTPTGILVEGVELFRPLAWKTDGVSRKVKNIFEIKNGKDVTLRRSILQGCWADGQQGEAILLTPALDGARTTPPLRSGDVTNVLVEDVTIRDCGSVVNMLGRAYSAYTVNALSGVVFRRVDAVVSRAKFGGRGQLAIIGGEPADVAFENVTFAGDGSSLIYYYGGDVLDPVTRQSRQAGKLGRLSLTGSRCTLGEWGIMLGGHPNARNWQEFVGQLTVTGNAFTGWKAMQTALPSNTYA